MTSANTRKQAVGRLTPPHRWVKHQAKDKHILAVEHPLSTQPGRPALYRVADSNLRLYLATLRQAEEYARRGRPDTAFRLIQRRWTAWRGKAVEPLIREALELATAAGALPWPDTTAVGGWWNRQFNPEIDLVGADRSPIATRIHFTGSIKWPGTPFDHHDLAAHRAAAAHVPGYEPGHTKTVIVSHVSVTDTIDARSVEVAWDPGDVIDAWTS